MIEKSEMRFKNNGNIAEDKTQATFEKLFNTVKQTKYTEFYNYLVSKGTLNIKIEVKYYDMKDKDFAYLYLKESQFKKLLKSENFLIYFMTNNGSIFVTPKQIFKFAHIHHHEFNKNVLNIIMKFKFINGNLFFTDLIRCKRCLGKIKDVINIEVDKYENIEMFCMQS